MEGFARVTPAMPGWNPTMKDQDILNVVAYIRSLSRR
jgi:mono/diheme cytochrome c family protein